jgi:hypothetical protein
MVHYNATNMHKKRPFCQVKNHNINKKSNIDILRILHHISQQTKISIYWWSNNNREFTCAVRELMTYKGIHKLQYRIRNIRMFTQYLQVNWTNYHIISSWHTIHKFSQV